MTSETGLVNGPCTGGTGAYPLVFFAHTVILFAACNLSFPLSSDTLHVCGKFLYVSSAMWLLCACAGRTAAKGSSVWSVGQAIGLLGAMMIS